MKCEKKKIAIVHPEIKGGGGESVLAWTLEALKDKYDITLISTDKFDFEFINPFYATQLSEGDFKVLRIFPFGFLFPKRFYLLKRHLIARYCKKNTEKYDLFFSTQNEMDFGKAGLQYIHFPVHRSQFLQDTERVTEQAKNPGSLRFCKVLERYGGVLRAKLVKRPHIHHLPGKVSKSQNLFYRVYIRIANVVTPLDAIGIKKNQTVVNSAWTGKVVRQVYGLDSTVIFPPVLSDSLHVPFENRKNGFVCIGWIRPEKELEKIMDIVSKLRKNGHTDITLEIIGPTWNRAYAKKIKAIARRKGAWISFHGELKRENLMKLISEYRFGIHGFQNEHFGIAVAEMVKAGNIVFVPNGGGQREIVNYDQRLIYSSTEDAVKKIDEILHNRELQNELSDIMHSSGQRFSSVKFMQQIQIIVHISISQNLSNE